MKRYLTKVGFAFVASVILIYILCGSNARLDLILEQVRQTRSIPLQQRFLEKERSVEQNCIIIYEGNLEYATTTEGAGIENNNVLVLGNLMIEETLNTQPGDEKLPDPVTENPSTLVLVE